MLIIFVNAQFSAHTIFKVVLTLLEFAILKDSFTIQHCLNIILYEYNMCSCNCFGLPLQFYDKLTIIHVLSYFATECPESLICVIYVPCTNRK